MSFLAMSQLGALGQIDCGPAPGLGPGERKACCPDIGWVIFTTESQYGICERARAQVGGAPGDAPPPESPLARVAERRRQLEERREAAEERRFQEQLQEVRLRFVLGRAQAQRSAVAAREQATRDVKSAKLAARVKARADVERRKRNEKLLKWGVAAGAAVGVAKVLGLF